MHKTKHRILQSLLILQPNLNKLNSALLQERLCNLMLMESNQHSVRLMQEWILIRIFVDNITFQVKLWQFFEQVFKEISIAPYSRLIVSPKSIKPNRYNFYIGNCNASWMCQFSGVYCISCFEVTPYREST